MNSIRNIAIIAHVDHGKTTLVDKIFYETNVLSKEESNKDLVLDNNDLERERGITILSKNVSVRHNGVKINIIDTPGHADFGGEVERVLKMVEGVILLVDAFEGPMPQTRFVLGKAIELGLKPIVVINKVDKENCKPEDVHEDVFDLMFNLGASEEQLDFKTLYGSSKFGWMSTDWKEPTDNMNALLDEIVETIPPAKKIEGGFQMQITTIDYTVFTGRIAIGRIARGDISDNQQICLVSKDQKPKKERIKSIYVFEGLEKVKVSEVQCGDICGIVGIDNFEIGDTITDPENPEALPRINIDEPTMSMLFLINNSPFFGKEGKFVTSRHLRDRLYRETEKNLALRVENTGSEDRFSVFGRGILHLSILAETMRREGFEFQVGKPQVIIKEIEGVKSEPIEHLVIDVPEQYSGKIIELVTQRKGALTIMEPKGDLQHLEFDIPARGLIGLRNIMLTMSSGTVIATHRFSSYKPYKGDLPQRINGSMFSIEQGTATPYAINKLQDRGTFLVNPGEEIYKGQVIGENNRNDDLGLNLIKGKQLTNMRAAGSDDNTKIAPKKLLSLEETLEYIKDDEYVEITPKSIRIRKIKV